MTIHHHLSDATLMSYAAGNVSEAISLVIAAHLDMCPACRAKLDELETLGALELVDAPLGAMAPDSLDKVLAQLDQQEDPAEIPRSRPTRTSGLPGPLGALVSEPVDRLPWRSLAPGIKTYRIASVNARRGTLCLMRIEPGVTIPEHTHEGTELTLVLKGSFSDEVGRFTSGDIADLDDDTEHTPIADTAEPCICLIATEAPLRFKNVVPRIMQYFRGM